MWLRQRDGVTCGPSVAVMAGALLNDDYGAPLASTTAQQWFAAEQGRVHRSVNMVWPRALGTTPAGMARALSVHGRRYRWRPAVRRDEVADVCEAVADGWPVAMLIGAAIPRHWVLLTEVDDDTVRCYEPGAGALVAVSKKDIRNSRLRPLGFPRPFAFVLPG
ncbi:hypothetical protein [Mycolicibacterium sp.]|uniref:hypothetical protein n=1 Tax=Mycolicibacterium sp. TaxID=2320850 RepID=UPI0025D3BBDD|nr:hypothetical protein [Mycolicibacterium sp.]